MCLRVGSDSKVLLRAAGEHVEFGLSVCSNLSEVVPMSDVFGDSVMGFWRVCVMSCSYPTPHGHIILFYLLTMLLIFVT